MISERTLAPTPKSRVRVPCSRLLTHLLFRADAVDGLVDLAVDPRREEVEARVRLEGGRWSEAEQAEKPAAIHACTEQDAPRRLSGRRSSLCTIRCSALHPLHPDRNTRALERVEER
jgi:hypothetical protein